MEMLLGAKSLIWDICGEYVWGGEDKRMETSMWREKQKVQAGLLLIYWTFGRDEGGEVFIEFCRWIC